MKIQSPPLHSTPYTITFIKIAVSCTSLIPYLVLPRELRETTEGTPKEDHMTKKSLFLRLSPKKVDLIPEKVVSHPKKVDSIPEKKLTYLFKEKITSKGDFSCSIQNISLPLHRVS